MKKIVFFLYSPTKITGGQTHLSAALFMYVVMVVVVVMIGEMIETFQIFFSN